MSEKKPVVETLISYLTSIGNQRTTVGGKPWVDDLALLIVRFIERTFRESELSPEDTQRAQDALKSAYAVVDPSYDKSRIYLVDTGDSLSEETERILRAFPKVPHLVRDIPIGDSAPDEAIKNFIERKKHRKNPQNVRG